MKLWVMVVGGLCVVPVLTIGQLSKTVDVSGGGQKFETFSIPEGGSSLELKITTAGSDKVIDSIDVRLEDDTVQWVATAQTDMCVTAPPTTPALYKTHIFEAITAPVFSSREWVWINGTVVPCNATGSGGGAPATIAFDLDVPGPDIDIDNVTEANEESVGGFVCVGANCLVKVTINPVQPASRHSGTVTLSGTGIGTTIELWENADRTGPIASGATFSTPSALPKDIWVEGIAASDALRDVELKVSYTAPDGKKAVDKVRLTVVSIDLEGLQGSIGNCSMPSTMVDLCGQDAKVQATVSPIDALPLVSFVFDDANVASISSRNDVPGTGITTLTLRVEAGSPVRHFTYLRGQVGGTTSEDAVQVYGRQRNALKPVIQAGQAYIGARIVTTLSAEPSRHLFVVRPDGTFWAITRRITNPADCLSLNCGVITLDEEAVADEFVYLFPYSGDVATLEAAIVGYNCVCYQFCSQNSNTAINTVTGGQLPGNRGWTPGSNVQNNNNPCNCAP